MKLGVLVLTALLWIGCTGDSVPCGAVSSARSTHDALDATYPPQPIYFTKIGPPFWEPWGQWFSVELTTDTNAVAVSFYATDLSELSYPWSTDSVNFSRWVETFGVGCHLQGNAELVPWGGETIYKGFRTLKSVPIIIETDSGLPFAGESMEFSVGYVHAPHKGPFGGWVAIVPS